MRPSTIFRIMPVVVTLLGCRYYYTKPGATDALFNADHAACVKEVGKISADGMRAYVATNDYRGCMQLRGWRRAEQANPGPEWYRGIEEDGVYSADTPPENRHSAEAMAQLREHCRRIHLSHSDWRQRLDRYNECLRR
jgi:hypothetical protein